VTRAGKTDVSVIFDVEHDEELYDELLEQSQCPGSGFAVTGGSERFTGTDSWSQRVRRQIRRADQVIIICGEHTDESQGVFSELRIAQEEEKPYLLLWGRREVMCTKPLGAKPSDGMYRWTTQVIQDQIEQSSRKSHRESAAKALKRPRAVEKSASADTTAR